MHISHLRASGLRNLAPLDLPLGRQMVVFEGRNGQGKTNLLEAVYLCATGRSFRLAPVPEIIAHGRGAAQVEAALERQGGRHDIVVRLAGRGRSVAIDGRRGRHAHHLFTLINVVAFFPDDLRIVKEGPERRRQFLDRAVANHDPGFVAAALAYQRAQQARNALLRQPSPPDRGLVAAYDAQIVRHGVVVHLARRRFLGRWAQACRAHLRRLMPELGDGPDVLGLALSSGVAAWDAASPDAPAAAEDAEEAGFAAAFAAGLQGGYPRDRARGFGHTGPHRGDLHIRLGGWAARQFASQGQQRAIVLCLKLAEVTVLHARLGTAPVVLLDDISSELDPPRTEALFALVCDIAGQAFVTTTDAGGLPIAGDTQRIAVQDGHLRV